MARDVRRTSHDLRRRAEVAGVAGSLLFGGALIGVAARHDWLVFWTFVAFLGLGSILRASMFAVAALRTFRAEQGHRDDEGC